MSTLRRWDVGLAHPLRFWKHSHIIGRDAEPLRKKLVEVREEDRVLQQGRRVSGVVHRDITGMVQLRQAAQEPQGEES